LVGWLVGWLVQYSRVTFYGKLEHVLHFGDNCLV